MNNNYFTFLETKIYLLYAMNNIIIWTLFCNKAKSYKSSILFKYLNILSFKVCDEYKNIFKINVNYSRAPGIVLLIILSLALGQFLNS